MTTVEFEKALDEWERSLTCEDADDRYGVARSAQARARVVAEYEREREWHTNVARAIRSTPQFTAGEWGGSREGWGFNCEVVWWLNREHARLTAELAAERQRAEGLRADAEDRDRAYGILRLELRTWEQRYTAIVEQVASTRTQVPSILMCKECPHLAALEPKP